MTPPSMIYQYGNQAKKVRKTRESSENNKMGGEYVRSAGEKGKKPENTDVWSPALLSFGIYAAMPVLS
jgi:hypothetical protein